MKQHVIDLQTSLEFTNCVSEISLNTNIILCPTEIIKNSKHSLDSSTMINGTNIPNIHGIRKQFQKSPLLWPCNSDHYSDSSLYKEFSCLAGKFSSAQALHVIDFQSLQTFDHH